MSGRGVWMNTNHEMDHDDIKELRESLLSSRSQLAKQAGISQQTVYRLESGNGCRIETRRKVILALGSIARTKFLEGISVPNKAKTGRARSWLRSSSNDVYI
jgi:DNA-binding XRE family transcriptional regulator